MEYKQPELISVNYYKTISAEELNPYKRLNANYIRGHVSEGEQYRMRCHANIPIHGMELMLMPGYYENFLEKNIRVNFQTTNLPFGALMGFRIFRNSHCL